MNRRVVLGVVSAIAVVCSQSVPSVLALESYQEIEPVQSAEITQGLASRTLPAFPALNDLLPDPVNPRWLKLSLSQKKVTLYSGDQVIKSYPVAVGRPGHTTPLGEHKISAMYKNPIWKHWDKNIVVPAGDPENPLGTRWIGFWSGKAPSGNPATAGFHGTTNEARSSVGTAASSGCVRMLRENVEELFDLVSMGMTVKVVQ